MQPNDLDFDEIDALLGDDIEIDEIDVELDEFGDDDLFDDDEDIFGDSMTISAQGPIHVHHQGAGHQPNPGHQAPPPGSHNIYDDDEFGDDDLFDDDDDDDDDLLGADYQSLIDSPYIDASEQIFLKNKAFLDQHATSADLDAFFQNFAETLYGATDDLVSDEFGDELDDLELEVDLMGVSAGEYDDDEDEEFGLGLPGVVWGRGAGRRKYLRALGKVEKCMKKLKKSRGRMHPLAVLSIAAAPGALLAWPFTVAAAPVLLAKGAVAGGALHGIRSFISGPLSGKSFKQGRLSRKKKALLRRAKQCDKRYNRLRKIWTKLRKKGYHKGLQSPRKAIGKQLSWIKRDALKLKRKGYKVSAADKRRISRARRYSQSQIRRRKMVPRRTVTTHHVTPEIAPRSYQSRGQNYWQNARNPRQLRRSYRAPGAQWRRISSSKFRRLQQQQRAGRWFVSSAHQSQMRAASSKDQAIAAQKQALADMQSVSSHAYVDAADMKALQRAAVHTSTKPKRMLSPVKYRSSRAGKQAAQRAHAARIRATVQRRRQAQLAAQRHQAKLAAQRRRAAHKGLTYAQAKRREQIAAKRSAQKRAAQIAAVKRTRKAKVPSRVRTVAAVGVNQTRVIAARIRATEGQLRQAMAQHRSAIAQSKKYKKGTTAYNASYGRIKSYATKTTELRKKLSSLKRMK